MFTGKNQEGKSDLEHKYAGVAQKGTVEKRPTNTIITVFDQWTGPSRALAHRPNYIAPGLVPEWGPSTFLFYSSSW